MSADYELATNASTVDNGAGFWNATTALLNETAPQPTKKDPFSIDSGVNVELGLTGLMMICLLCVPNSLAVVLIYRSKRFLTCAADLLVMNVCLVNAIVPVAIGPLAMIKYFTGVYPGRWEVCNVQWFIIALQNSGNQLTLAVMTAERFTALKYPFFYKSYIDRNRRMFVVLLILIWSLSGLYSALHMIAPGIARVKLFLSFCGPVWGDPQNEVFS